MWKMVVEICHVCKKEKKPYSVFIDSSIFSFICYKRAREDGPICQRCNDYYGMTGEFKDPTDKELMIARDSVRFANDVLRWWEKDGKMDLDSPCEKRAWVGTKALAKWYREQKK